MTDTAAPGASPSRPRPTLAQTTRLVARALGMTPPELSASLRTATLQDLPGMLALRERVLAGSLDWDDRAYLTWRYRLGRTAAHGGGECWLLTREDRILGMVGTQDVLLRCGTRTSPTLSLMDIMIQPDLEGAGLGTWLNLAMQERSDTTLAIGANPHSIGMVSRLFDTLPNRRTFVHPVRLGHFMRTRLPVPALANAIAFSAETLVRLANALLLGPWSLGLKIRPVSDDLEALAALQSRTSSDTLVQDVRTAAQWRWRLLDNPRARCQLWGAWSGTQLKAAVATSLKPLDGQRQALVVVDSLVSLPHDQRAFRALLWHVLKQAWIAEVDYVVLTTCRRDLERELLRMGFRHQPHPYETLSWTCKDPAFKDLVAQRPDWTLSEFHTDRI